MISASCVGRMHADTYICLLLASFATHRIVAACGGGYVYLFYDINCGSDDHNPAWILSPKKPDPTRVMNLHRASQGGCHNYANWATTSMSLLGTSTWGSWDGCCGQEKGQRFDVTITSVRMGNDIRISGLCAFDGGKQVNQVWTFMGTTTGGRPWYRSSTKLSSYEAEDIHDETGEAIAAIVGLLVMMCCIAGCVAFAVFYCYRTRICCFSGPRVQYAPNPGMQQPVVVMGQVVQAQPVVVQATVAPVVQPEETNETNPTK